MVSAFVFSAVLALAQCGPNGCALPQYQPYRQFPQYAAPPPQYSVPQRATSQVGLQYVTQATLPRYRATVRIGTVDGNGHNSYGSGVIVRWGVRPFILTASHVVRDATAITIWLPEMSAGRSVRLLKTDSDWDAAVLDPGDDRKLPAVDIEHGPVAHPKPGELLDCCGYGQDGKLAIAKGQMLRFIGNGRGGPSDWLAVSGCARQGDSGGPIFNSAGNVVGVLWGTDSREILGVQAGRLHILMRSAVGEWPVIRQTGLIVPRVRIVQNPLLSPGPLVVTRPLLLPRPLLGLRHWVVAPQVLVTPTPAPPPVVQQQYRPGQPGQGGQYIIKPPLIGRSIINLPPTPAPVINVAPPASPSPAPSQPAADMEAREMAAQAAAKAAEALKLVNQIHDAIEKAGSLRERMALKREELEDEGKLHGGKLGQDMAVLKATLHERDNKNWWVGGLGAVVLLVLILLVWKDIKHKKDSGDPLAIEKLAAHLTGAATAQPWLAPAANLAGHASTAVVQGVERLEQKIEALRQQQPPAPPKA